MTPLEWRAKARDVLLASGQRCFVRFARAGEETLLITDAQDTAALEAAGFCVQARVGRVSAFDVPDAWYMALVGFVPESETDSPVYALWHRLSRARSEEDGFTQQGRAFLREVARGCFASGGADEKTILNLRAQAAVLQRRRDTGAFAAAAGLAAAACSKGE